MRATCPFLDPEPWRDGFSWGVELKPDPVSVFFVLFLFFVFFFWGGAFCSCGFPLKPQTRGYHPQKRHSFRIPLLPIGHLISWFYGGGAKQDLYTSQKAEERRLRVLLGLSLNVPGGGGGFPPLSNPSKHRKHTPG